MSEYMDYDDSIYDNLDHKQSRSKKIRSWISVILSAAFLISIVVLVFVRMPKTVRVNFATVSSDEHLIGEKFTPLEENEFYKLYSALEKGTVKYNRSLKKNYPTAYTLITDSFFKVNQNKLCRYDMNGALTIAQSRELDMENKVQTKTHENITNAKVIEFKQSRQIMIDVLIVPYSGEKDITVSAPVHYTIGCYTGKGTDFITEEYVNNDVFSLNFYSISVKIKSGSGENIKTVNAALNFTDGITKAEAEKNSLYNKLSLENGNEDEYSLISGGERGDRVIQKQLTAGDISTEAVVKAEFDNVMYRKFESLNVTPSENGTFNIIVN